MKIIQSYWTLPSLSTDLDISGRSKGGFLDMRFNYMSWALSCLSLKKFYKNVELITDKQGADLLIDTLKLPYTHVSVALDALNDYHPKLWAIGKLKAYQLQNDPFLHVDGDVFIWKPFDKAFLSNQLIVQNIEKSYDYYSNILDSLTLEFDYIPKVVKENYSVLKDLTSVNAGIIGGNDIAFFKSYTTKAFDFVDKNIDKLENVNTGLFNCVYEQYLFYCLAKEKNIDISPFLQLKPQEEFSELMSFNLVPFEKAYIHLIGFAKNNIYACEQVEMRLKYEFPQYYALIANLFEKSYFPTRDERFSKLKSTYAFLDTVTIDAFLEKPFQLSDHVTVNNDEAVSKLIYTSPQTNQAEEITLDGWDSVLEAFAEPTSGNEMLEIFVDDDISNEEELNALKLNIVNFLTDKLIYKDILTFA